MSITSTKSPVITIRIILPTQLLIECSSKIIVDFHSKHINKTRIFLRIIEGCFFFFGEIKCKQDVKNFEKHPNKIEIFLCIVEKLFTGEFFVFKFGFTLFFLKMFL